MQEHGDAVRHEHGEGEAGGVRDQCVRLGTFVGAVNAHHDVPVYLAHVRDASVARDHRMRRAIRLHGVLGVTPWKAPLSES